jgi:hypothetical protein
MCNIWKTIYAKVTSDFNCRRLFIQNLASLNSKRKYESGKILDFAKKIRKIDFKKNEFILIFNYFECFTLFWIFFIIFIIIFKYFEFLINNWIMHKDYLKFIVAY